ncbi:Hypothetical predicted protein [Mytilus galloprovincialis]|uniref:Uncharacterized protein n=1 Tax=Mytilus galloprovincialis TaxID=29158 RepID=A0A8B6CYN8_MYTGA|nr:Hypothetical predicted protein [Mytilus galloprovincialis]
MEKLLFIPSGVSKSLKYEVNSLTEEEEESKCDIEYGCVGGTTVMPECEIGYASKDGFPCVACSRGRWGRKCGYTCSCQQNERCDIVFGCVDEHFGMSDGLLSIIYSMGVGSIVAMVALAFCCFKYKRKAEYLNNARFPRVHNNIDTTEPANINRNNVRSYDIIDENTMIDHHTLTLMRIGTSNEHLHPSGIRYPTTDEFDLISSSFSQSTESEFTLSEFNYGSLELHAPMTEVEIHSYETLPNEIAKTFEKISSENIGTIINSEPIYSNITSYQQIILNGDMHKYTPLDEEGLTHSKNEQCISVFQTGNHSSNIENAEQISTLLRKGVPMKVESEDIYKNEVPSC